MTLKWMPQDFIHGKSKFIWVQVMDWCLQEQAITWANVDPVFCHHLASLGLNELIVPPDDSGCWGVLPCWPARQPGTERAWWARWAWRHVSHRRERGNRRKRYTLIDIELFPPPPPSVLHILKLFNSLWPSDAIWWHRSVNINISSGNGLLPDGTKPLPEPMLTHHQRGSVAFFKEQFRWNCSRRQFKKWVWKLHTFNITSTSPRGQWVKLMRSDDKICNSNMLV